MRLYPVIFVMLFTFRLLSADVPKPVIINAVVDQYRPFPFDSQRLIGLLATRIRANREGFLESTAAPVSPEAISEFLDIASNAYDYGRDPGLKILLDKTAGAIFSNTHALPAPELLPGLLSYYRITGAPLALSLSRRIADDLISRKQEADAAGIIESFIVLFRYTGDSGYIEAAKGTSNRWLSDHLRDTLTPDPVSLAPKLRLFAALIDMYRTTGDESYLQPAVSFWRNLDEKYIDLTGTVRFSTADKAPASACITVAWMQLTLELLRITGQPLYASALERTIYNQLFAGQDPKTGQVCPAVLLEGTKNWSGDREGCAWEQARGATMIPAVAWGRYGKGISINLYSGGRATVRLRRRGTIQLYSEASFPESGQILLHVEPDHNIQFPLRLRVPEWTSSFVAEFAGSRLMGKPGQYLTITRQWTRGDTVKIQIDLTGQIIAGAGEHASEIALKRGPQLLALGTTLNPGLKDLSRATVLVTGAVPSLTPKERILPANWVSDQAYAVEGEYDGKPQQFTLIPFADALHYRVWLRRSERSPTASLQSALSLSSARNQ